MIDYEFLYAFSKDILNLDKTIRWVGISNKLGVLLNVEQREGLIPFMSEEENEEYAANAIARYKSRIKFESKIGKLLYAFGRYQKLNRATIPINDNFYLLIALDVQTKDFDKIIMEKIIPHMEKEKHKFVSDDDIRK